MHVHRRVEDRRQYMHIYILRKIKLKKLIGALFDRDIYISISSQKTGPRTRTDYNVN